MSYLLTKNLLFAILYSVLSTYNLSLIYIDTPLTILLLSLMSSLIWIFTILNCAEIFFTNKKLSKILKFCILSLFWIYIVVQYATIYFTGGISISFNTIYYIIASITYGNITEHFGVHSIPLKIELFKFIFFITISILFLYYFIFKLRYLETSSPKKIGTILIVSIILEFTVSLLYKHNNYDLYKIHNSIPWYPNFLSNYVLKLLGKIHDPIKLVPFDEFDKKTFFYRLHNSEIKSSNKKLPNVIVIAVESLRYNDDETTDLMPFLYSQNGIFSKKHFSTSPSTHYGFFSAMTGLFPNYYDECIDNNYCMSPLMIFLKKLGYKISMLNSIDYRWFDLEKIFNLHNNKIVPCNKIIDNVFFSSDQNLGEFCLGNESLNDQIVSNDLSQLDNLKKLLEDNSNPHMISIFLNSTHFSYAYPKGQEKYLPVVKYGSWYTTHDERVTNKDLSFNRYKNSVSFVDTIIKDIFNILGSSERENIILVFGDHGEEFGENGNFMHGFVGGLKSLTKYTLRTVMYFKFPESNNKIWLDRPSSHLDFLPTIFHYYKDRYNIDFEIDLPGLNLLQNILENRTLIFSSRDFSKKELNFLCNEKIHFFGPNTDKEVLLELCKLAH